VNCQDLLEQLSEYIDQETRQELCLAIEEHLERCQDCRVVVDQTRKTITLYQAGQPIEIPGLVAATERLQIALAKAYVEKGDRPSD
jgi:predicted anti-sigma-YlaC factor YlaD